MRGACGVWITLPTDALNVCRLALRLAALSCLLALSVPAQSPPATPPAVSNPQAATNYVLALNGGRGYFELPPQIFDTLDEATVECWVKWNSASAGHLFDFGQVQREVYVTGDDFDYKGLKLLMASPDGVRHRIEVPGSLTAG
jgi:hypothetical protein